MQRNQLPEGMPEFLKMPSTYTSLNIHIIFSTKGRFPFLTCDLVGRVHEYIGGTVRGLEGVALAIGGVEDHVHILAGISANQKVSDLVREIKKASNKWMREEIGVKSFSWQEGYAAFSVSPERCLGVKRYIANQTEHHKKVSFMDELRQLLEYSGVAFDDKYLE